MLRGLGTAQEHSHPTALQNGEMCPKSAAPCYGRPLAAKPTSIPSPLFLANTTLIWFNQGTRFRWWKPDSVIVLCLVTQSCPTLCEPMDCSPGASVHEDSPRKNTGVGCHAILQQIFPTQGWNSGLPHCRQILYRLNQTWLVLANHDLLLSFTG